MTMKNEQSTSEPAYSGQTAISLHDLFREVRVEMASMNCSAEQVALGAAHLAALQVLARENVARHPLGRYSMSSVRAPSLTRPEEAVIICTSGYEVAVWADYGICESVITPPIHRA